MSIKKLINTPKPGQVSYVLKLLLSLEPGALREELKEEIGRGITKKGVRRGPTLEAIKQTGSDLEQEQLIAALAVHMGHEVTFNRIPRMSISDLPEIIWKAHRVNLKDFSFEELCGLTQAHAHPKVLVELTERPLLGAVMNLGELSVTHPEEAKRLISFFESSYAGAAGEREDAAELVRAELGARGVTPQITARVARLAAQIAQDLNLKRCVGEGLGEGLWVGETLMHESLYRRVSSRLTLCAEIDENELLRELRLDSIERSRRVHHPRSEQGVKLMPWINAVSLCNQLSALEGLDPAYTISEESAPQVKLNPSAGGYRLLTSDEWEVVTPQLMALEITAERSKLLGRSSSPEKPDPPIFEWCMSPQKTQVKPAMRTRADLRRRLVMQADERPNGLSFRLCRPARA